MTKLNLNIRDEEVVIKVKQYAKENGTSVSKLVEDYFKLLISKNSPQEPENKKLNILKFRGSLKSDKSYKELIQEREND